MESIGNRIQMVLTSLGKKKIDLANDIGITSASVTTMCNGKSNPSNQTIKMICRVYGVNEEWLRNGTGEMFVARSLDDEIALFAGQVLKLPDDDPRVRIMKMLSQLPQEDWHAVTDMLDLLNEQKKSAGNAAADNKEV